MRRSTPAMPAVRPDGAAKTDGKTDGKSTWPDDDTATRLRTVVANAPIILFATDRNGIFTLSDGRGLEAMGLEPGQVVGQSALDFYGDVFVVDGVGETQTGAKLIERALAGESVSALATLGDRTFDTRVMPRFGPDGVAPAGMVGVSTDVTDRVRAEKALQEEDRRIAATLDSIGEGVVAGDRAGLVTRMNPVAAKLCGVTLAEALGKRLSEVVVVIAEASGQPVDLLGTGEGGREAPTRRFTDADLVLVARDGKKAPIAVTRTAMSDAAGEPEGVVLVLRDTSDERAATATQSEIQAQLLRSDRMAALGTLAAGVAHEINNPLTYMLVNVELVARRLRAIGVSDRGAASLSGAEGQRVLEPLIEALNHAAEGASRVRDIVRSLATFSRGDLDKRGLVDLRSVLESSIQMALHEIRHRARIVREFGEVSPVEANEARLGQVFLNLLVNAAHAIPEGNAQKHEVRVASHTDGSGRVVVEISDTGDGIPPEVLPRIFDPFFTTKPQGMGSGLGLSISHGTVMSLGGEMTVESTMGRGTTFRVFLPAARGWPLQSQNVAVPTFAARRRVLIVDDDVKLGQSLVRALEDDHDVTLVGDGSEAFALLESGKRYDLVLCDLLMPGMTGMDFYGEVLRLAPEVIGDIVFMTGGACTPRARAFVESVGNRCVEKPIDMNKLREMMRRGRERKSFV